jgi:thermitase
MPNAPRYLAVKGLLIVTLAGLPLLKAATPADHVPGRLLLGDRGTDTAVRDRILRLHGAALRRHLPELGFSIVDVPEESCAAVIASLQSTGLFAYVERDSYAHTAAVPNDPSYGSQWYLPRIHSAEAWGVTTGSATIVVAVIDSGVDAAHPDLTSKLVAGWNFVKSTSETVDVLGHGTAVAGTVAAASNNSIGIAGVTWASKVMPLVVVDDTDYASYSNIAAAIQYAADQGVRIINISIGGPASSMTMQNAVDYAWKKGALIFASAMNDSTSSPRYPAACNHVVAVSATDSADHLAGFSNYGSWITLSAPGTNILSTADRGGYNFWSGTSFASPIVAGVAALCLAENPALGNAALLSILLDTADDIGTPGFDTSFGYGRINAYRAVAAVRQAMAPPAATTTTTTQPTQPIQTTTPPQSARHPRPIKTAPPPQP